jgi:uncharacterized protein
MDEVAREVQLADEVGTDIIAIPAGSTLQVQVRFESVLEGVLATGTVDSVARGACVRCLESVSLPVRASFQELFAYADRAAHHVDVGDDDEDRYVLEGDLLDLEPMLRDAVVLQLPFQPVCRPDCPGLCVECGASLADDPDHSHETIDPRWASLQALATRGASDDDPGSATPGWAETYEKRN